MDRKSPAGPADDRVDGVEGMPGIDGEAETLGDGDVGDPVRQRSRIETGEFRPDRRLVRQDDGQVVGGKQGRAAGPSSARARLPGRDSRPATRRSQSGLVAVEADEDAVEARSAPAAPGGHRRTSRRRARAPAGGTPLATSICPMLIWHMTGTRSGRAPDMAAAIRSLEVIVASFAGRIIRVTGPVKGRGLQSEGRALSYERTPERTP